MREIKFRVWDQELKRYVFDGFTIEYNDCPELSISIVPCDNNRTIEQFTGLTDDYDKEIYDGDILGGKNGGKWVAEFKDGMFISRCIEGTMSVGKKGIIGNIHDGQGFIK